jgi:hypothetical protein
MTRPIDDGCQSCGRLIFLTEPGEKPGYDDVCSSPYVTESGDLFCIPCGREMDRAQREADEEDYYPDFDPYEGCDFPANPEGKP